MHKAIRFCAALIAALTLSVLISSFQTAFAQTCTPARPDLVSWWPGDGNALDSRSRNNGTIQGNVTFAAGEVGQTFNLGGTAGLMCWTIASRKTIAAWCARSSPRRNISDGLAQW